MAERDIQNEILRSCGHGDVRLFRQNVGTGWVGKSERIAHPGYVAVRVGDVIVRQARPLHAGLCEGSSDLIGWRSVEITPDMVGQRVAVFAGLEVKTDTGRATDEQRRFIAAIQAAGGIGAIVRSPDDAATALAGAVDK